MDSCTSHIYSWATGILLADSTELCKNSIIYFTFSLLVNDLKPNLGLYWYLVIEIFEQFRFFFVFVFQLIAFVFALPIGIRFKTDPIFCLLIMTLFISFMKSYPSIGDFGIYYGLLQCFTNLFPCINQTRRV